MRTKRTIALVAFLIAVAGVSFLIYRWVNRPRMDAATGIGDSGTAPPGEGGLGTSVFTNAAPKPRSASPAVATANPKAVVARVNPYSVVRDGICVPSNAPGQEKASRKKWEELLRDPYWQSVFSGANPDRFHLVKTSLPLERYVNYWKMENGQAIHWTGKKISIPSGTRVFTDGQGAMYLCACGNQVAAVLPPGKQETVLPAEDQPPTAYLVPPEAGSDSESPGDPSEESVALMAPSGLASPAPLDDSGSMPSGPSTPPMFMGGPSGGGGGSPSGSGQPGNPSGNPPGNPSGNSSGNPSGNPTGNPPGNSSGNPPGNPPGNPAGNPPSDPPVVPEPGTLSLILIGLGASAVARRRHKKGMTNSQR